MTTFLLCWYALGWSAAGIFTSFEERLTVADLAFLLLTGGASFCTLAFLPLLKSNLFTRVIWRKP